MKLKIFKLKPLLLSGLLLMANMGFAQQASGGADSSKEAYNQQMSKLRDQMRDLQKQMSKLQSEEFKKRSKDLQESAKKLRESGQYYSYDLSDLNKRLGNLNGIGISPNISIIPITPVVPLESLAPATTIYNYSYSDADVKKKIESGELKEKVKSYSKSYSVDRDDKLQISNRYGKVTVNTWNKNEVKVDIEMKAVADEEDEAQKMLDRVSITDSKENSVVSFKTNIESSNSGNHTFVIGTIFSSGKSSVRRMEVNYTIYMPSKNQLQISNRYGATILPDLQGKVVIDNAYGSLVAKSLSNPGNEIMVKYGSADIEMMGSGDLNVSYGSLKLGEADKLNANVSYSSAKIGKLTTSGTLTVRYCGGLQIAYLDKNLKSLSVNSSYSNVKVGLAENDNADFDITTRYGSFNYGDKAINIVNKTPGDEERGWSSTKTYKGKVGKGNADKLIVIRSNYGSVKFD
jgi:hypothetical protein